MTLAPPVANLRASVVVPARNEEAMISACLEALADQRNLSYDEYEVILVLDDCTDATEDLAREVARVHPNLRLHFLDGPGKGAGHARRVGMEAACERLLKLGRPAGLIASTDADTVVAPDWLSAQLECAARGARAIGGRIELTEEESLPTDVTRWRREQGTLRYQTLLADNAGVCNSVMEHWQFSGASMALTAAVYEEIGGLEPLTALEDEYLERVLRQRGVPIERPLTVKVRTSARRNGRAERGLAQDLALVSWYHGNTYWASDFDIAELRRVKRYCVSLVLAGECDSTEISGALYYLRDCGILDEVLRVNPSSEIGEKQSPRVYRAEDLMPDFGPVRGYGDLLWRGLSATRGELVVFLDPRQEDFIVERVCGLLGPLVEREELELVKGFMRTPDHLSEVVGRPLINLYHPKLAGFSEPLSKDFAARGQLLRALPFPVGPGVNLSLLLDSAERSGVDALAQTCTGDRPDSLQDSSDDGEAVYAILTAAASRTPGGSHSELTPGPFFMPGAKTLATRRVPVEERPSLESLRESSAS